MDKNKFIRTISILAVVVVAGIVLFFYLSNRSDEELANEKHKPMTAVQEILARNLDTNYPPTPKEVLRYYSEITRCFYSEDYTEEELEKLAVKSRELFDAELYNNQTDSDYLLALKADIDRYKSNNMVISSYSVSSSTDVNEYSYDGYDWAQLYCIYSVRQATYLTPVQERFLMRKDELGHWKIVGWELVKDEEE